MAYYWFNKTDCQALALCRIPTKRVVLYKDSPFIIGEYRQTLDGHLTEMEDFHLGIPLVKRIFDHPEHHHPALHRFCLDVLCKIPRHDMEEIIREPQSFRQKADPTLPQLNLGDIDMEIASEQYHLAQLFWAAGKPEEFLAAMARLQAELADFDDQAARLRGTEYVHYVENAFGHIINRMYGMRMGDRFSLTPEMRRDIDDNNARHVRHYRETEDPLFRPRSASGLFTKLLDKNLPYYNRCGRQRRDNPAMGGLLIERDSSAKVLKTIRRSQEFLPGFLTACDPQRGYAPMNASWETRNALVPLREPAYEMVFSHNAEFALLAAPVIHFDPEDQKSEPGLDASENAFRQFVTSARETLVRRRHNGIHPLADTRCLTNYELAAKAETMRQRGRISAVSVLDHMKEYDPDFVAQYDATLAVLQNHSTAAVALAVS